MRRPEQQHPFYKPLWRRVVIVIVIAIWLAVEFWQSGVGLWSTLAFGMLVYALYIFFLTWPKDDAAPPA